VRLASFDKQDTSPSGIPSVYRDSVLDANADHAHSHYPRWDVAQKWNAGESADKPRDVQGVLLLSPERRRGQPLLELRLKGLNNPYRPFTLALNSA
jgi:hypothetical protein